MDLPESDPTCSLATEGWRDSRSNHWGSQSTFAPDGTLTNWPIGFFAP